jgi:hypothetical protein
MAQVPSYVPTNGLLGWWPFDGNANDESGNGNNGTVNGATLTTDRFGNPNAAYDFDGNDDFIEIDNLESFDFSSAIGLSFWLYVDQFPASGGRVILSKQLSSSTSAIGFAVTATASETLTFRLGNGSPTTYTAVVNNSISAQVWHHVVCDFQNGTIRVFIDSNETGSTIQQNALVGQASIPMLIGAPTWTASNAFNFLGNIDDIGIWNRALTPCEIQELYTGQTLTPPTATITPNGNTTICSGGFVQLTASAADGYLWSNGETTQTITATQAGQYTVTVTNNDGCSDVSDPVTVTVNPTPNSGVSVSGATTFCSGGSVTLTSQASSGSYLWSNGETTQSITVNQTGNYSVTVTDNGCSATSGVTAVTVNQTPTATITPQGNTTFCQGGFVVLQAAGGGTYQWNTGSQASSINVSQSGTYTVIVTENGCNAQAQQQVTVNPLPTVTLAPFANLCENGAVMQLSGGSPSGGYYNVNGNATPQLNPYTYGAGNHTIEYVYADNNGCVNTATQPVTINATPAVNMSGLNTNYTLTDPFSTLTGTPTGGVFNGTGMVANYFDPSVAGVGTHGIAYIYVDGNGCIGSDAQCATVDLNVNIGGSNIGIDEGSIDVYPNPSNGLFSISVDGIDGIIRLSVFDARGREVLATSVVGNGQKTMQNIDLSNYANGVYTLSIRTAKGTATQKLVKE